MYYTEKQCQETLGIKKKREHDLEKISLMR